MKFDQRSGYPVPDVAEPTTIPISPPGESEVPSQRRDLAHIDRTELTAPAGDQDVESTAIAEPAAQPLFRTEVIEARRSQWLGPVLLTPRPSHRLFAMLAVLAIAAIGALLAFGEFTRKANVTGWLVPDKGLVQVFAPTQGVVAEVFHPEGAQVPEGAPLIALSAERQTGVAGIGTEAEIARSLETRRDSLESEIKQQQQLLNQQRSGLARRLQAMRAEIDQFDRELKVQQSRADLATRSADRMRDLGAQGFASKMQIQQQEENELEQRGRVRALERLKGERARDLAALQAEFDDLPFKARSQISSLKRGVAELDQDSANSEARRRIVIAAPSAGTISAMQVHPGSNANPATPLLSILPADSRLEAQLFTPSRSIGFVRVGQRVLLRYHAYPYQKFGHHAGTIKSISMIPISPNELPPQLSRLASLTTSGEPLYRISVELERQAINAYGESHDLHPGMQLDSDILLERRKLYEWILEPLFTLTGKL